MLFCSSHLSVLRRHVGKTGSHVGKIKRVWRCTGRQAGYGNVETGRGLGSKVLISLPAAFLFPRNFLHRCAVFPFS